MILGGRGNAKINAMELRRRALDLLVLQDPAAKADATRAAALADFDLDTAVLLTAPTTLPGRPAVPRLMSPLIPEVKSSLQEIS